jgi:proton-dependent oligopeptide transporter, POT family
MWEVFAIFGMRTALIYYLVKQLGFTQKHAVEVYSLAAAACVLMGLFGSLSADRFLGPRKAVILGAFLMATASFSLISEKFLYANLALMAIGNGFFKSTMVAQVGALYLSEDPRRDRAFVIYKVGCNLGAFIAPLICGTIGAIYGWNWAFAASGIGMLVSIAVFISGRAYLATGGPRKRSLAGPGGSERAGRSRSPSLGLLLLVWAGGEHGRAVGGPERGPHDCLRRSGIRGAGGLVSIVKSAADLRICTDGDMALGTPGTSGERGP